MSKIEIDTSEVSLEEQIDLAARGRGHVLGDGVRGALQDLLRGKYAKAPLPEIKKLKWATYTRIVFGARGYFVEASAGEPEHTLASGPVKPTQREAILAFNELFGGAE